MVLLFDFAVKKARFSCALFARFVLESWNLGLAGALLCGLSMPTTLVMPSMAAKNTERYMVEYQLRAGAMGEKKRRRLQPRKGRAASLSLPEPSAGSADSPIAGRDRKSLDTTLENDAHGNIPIKPAALLGKASPLEWVSCGH